VVTGGGGGETKGGLTERLKPLGGNMGPGKKERRGGGSQSKSKTRGAGGLKTSGCV